ncbi:hypothetical protein FRX31_027601 [Thalictrum thalictroides]|uniref:Uncharacterized protein n=1 Tax=Thalictrum thalictroides TaxID=46969 RepID=A0A7J6VDP9_THATH|nr:hypothetical protein FRX31_027601 [Thalictrum thalictroides]
MGLHHPQVRDLARSRAPKQAPESLHLSRPLCTTLLIAVRGSTTARATQATRSTPPARRGGRVGKLARNHPFHRSTIGAPRRVLMPTSSRRRAAGWLTDQALSKCSCQICRRSQFSSSSSDVSSNSSYASSFSTSFSSSSDSSDGSSVMIVNPNYNIIENPIFV